MKRKLKTFVTFNEKELSIWRLIKPDGSLNIKSPDGVKAQAVHCCAMPQSQFAYLVASAIPAMLT
jgi:hypothetical protein